MLFRSLVLWLERFVALVIGATIAVAVLFAGQLALVMSFVAVPMFVTAWLALSLFAGGQCAWYMRPFFGIGALKGDSPPFFLGTAPDFRGARSFYEAVWNLVQPPR